MRRRNSTQRLQSRARLRALASTRGVFQTGARRDAREECRVAQHRVLERKLRGRNIRASGANLRRARII